MELSGFTEEQLTVRDAMMKICKDFPDASHVLAPTAVVLHLTKLTGVLGGER